MAFEVDAHCRGCWETLKLPKRPNRILVTVVRVYDLRGAVLRVHWVSEWVFGLAEGKHSLVPVMPGFDEFMPTLTVLTRRGIFDLLEVKPCPFPLRSLCSLTLIVFIIQRHDERIWFNLGG